jgi:hypothetical protein
MQLTQCMEEAKLQFTTLLPNETIVFDMVDEQERKITCEWKDPYDGVFTIDGTNGFTTVNEYLIKNPHVDNMKVVPRNRK